MDWKDTQLALTQSMKTISNQWQLLLLEQNTDVGKIKHGTCAGSQLK